VVGVSLSSSLRRDRYVFCVSTFEGFWWTLSSHRLYLAHTNLEGIPTVLVNIRYTYTAESKGRKRGRGLGTRGGRGAALAVCCLFVDSNITRRYVCSLWEVGLVGALGAFDGRPPFLHPGANAEPHIMSLDSGFPPLLVPSHILGYSKVVANSISGVLR
jgi:hypothetical protein